MRARSLCRSSLPCFKAPSVNKCHCRAGARPLCWRGVGWGEMGGCQRAGYLGSAAFSPALSPGRSQEKEAERISPLHAMSQHPNGTAPLWGTSNNQ